MAVVPRKMADMIRWYQQRQAAWTSNQAAIGLQASDTTTLAAKITAAVNALDADDAAKTASKDATVALHDAARPLAAFGAECIKKIKAKAGQDGTDQAYVLASIPPPATPQPVGKPGTPFDLKIELKPVGIVELKWSCTNPSGAHGTIYHVYRQNGGVGEFNFLGGSGQKDFTDATLPAGQTMVVYRVQALRSNSIGDANDFQVKFGVTAGGDQTASVESGPKLAA